jgi:hypothetical protein
MNVKIGTEATQFPEKEYIAGIFLAVWEICTLAKSYSNSVSIAIGTSTYEAATTQNKSWQTL